MRDTEELELGAFNLAPAHAAHRQAAERNLFASGGVDTFHLTFAEELGEPAHAILTLPNPNPNPNPDPNPNPNPKLGDPVHAELRTDHDNLTWSVERVVLGRVQGAPSLGGAGGASARAARCVTFEAREGGGGGAMGGLSPRRSSASSAVSVSPG